MHGPSAPGKAAAPLTDTGIGAVWKTAAKRRLTTDLDVDFSNARNGVDR
jgi:hypothetical protein